MTLGSVSGQEPYPCVSTPRNLPSWMLILATRGGYVSPTFLPARLDPSLFTCFLAYISSSLLDFDFHISTKPAESTAWESIQHYRSYSTIASSHMCPNNLHPPSPSTEVNPKWVLSCSALGYLTDASSPEPQPPRLSSTCWTHCWWPAPSFWQIALRRIHIASG